MQRTIGFQGDLKAKVIHNQPPLSWKLRRLLYWPFIKGWIQYHLSHLMSKVFGLITITSKLEAVLFRADGSVVKFGVLSYRSVTTAGAGYLVDDWDNSATDITNMKYHGCGIGTNAEAVGDTQLQSECTTVLNPDNTRATGTNTQPTSVQLQTVGTLTFDGSAAVTEHGILSQAATGGGVLWDRSVFSGSPINVTSGDSIQFTYTLTVSTGT